MLPGRNPWRLSLDSESDWRFNWCRRPSLRPRDFYRPDYDVSSWPVVKVPCSWQAMGIRASGERFESPLYIDPSYSFAPDYPKSAGPGAGKVTGHPIPSDWTFGPEDNPVGSYRRDFQLPDEWLGGNRIVIRFDGVESFYYLWVNGTYVGFSKSSRDAAEFDVTDLVKRGRNTVAVEVYRNSDGAWLESMDIWRLSGIFRSVSVHRVPKTHVRDVSLTTAPVRKGEYDGDWAVDLRIDHVGSEPRALGVKVFDAAGAPVKYEGTAGAACRLVFVRPALWSAESPNLYTLVVESKAFGRTVEAIPFQLGFREVEIRGAAGSKDRVFLFNGKPIKLKGANRHEVDPLYGHYTPDECILRDVRLLKEGNFNYVRNCHYPQPPYFYHLANKYGLYVMDEANLETHATTFGKDSLSHDPAWRPAFLRRVRNMVESNKCQPCVVIWSLGNETGPGENLRSCYEWVHEHDRTRPVHYEGNNAYADMGSCMYPSVEKVAGIAAGDDAVRQADAPVKYPFTLCEYAHNLAHGVGNLADFQAAIESSDRVFGGAVWDFADQSLYAVDSKGRRYLAFSGDFGEKPEDGIDGVNGYVLADRRPEPAYYEAWHVFRPFRLSAGSDGRSLVLENVNFFRDASSYACRLSVLENGRQVGEPKPVKVDLPPRASCAIALPDDALRLMAEGVGLVSVRLEVVLGKDDGLLSRGHLVARDQVDFGQWRSKEAPVTEGQEPVRLHETVQRLELSSGDVRLAFDRSTGALVSLKRSGRELLARGMELDVFRAPTSGDTDELVDGWMREGFRTMRPVSAEFSSVCQEKGALRFEVCQQFRGERSERLVDYPTCHPRIADCGPTAATNVRFVVRTRYSFGPDGTLSVRSRFRQEGPALEPPRVGWRFVLDEGEETIRWIGKGPWENYADCGSCCQLGTWTLPLGDFQFPYGRNEDSGNRERVHEVAFERCALVFRASGEPFSFMASPYSPAELVGEPHFEFLPGPEKTELGLYAKVRGLGSGNCGPKPLRRDRIGANEELELAFALAVSADRKQTGKR